MATEITMPKMGLSMVTGKVGKWLKKEGDAVKQGEEILEIMTDKISNVVEAPADGTLLKIVAVEETELPIGGLMGIIGSPGEDISIMLPAQPVAGAIGEVAAAVEVPVTLEKAETPGEKVKISPVARKLADEKGIDISKLVGTGPAGRITREDVEKAVAEAAAGAAVPVDVANTAGPDFELSPYGGIRKIIGDNMAKSWAAAPKVNYHVSVDISALQALRKELNEEGTHKITLTDLIVKIVAQALKMRPVMNVSLDGNNIKTYKNVHIGVAVALEKGLVVPVVRNADTKRLADVSREIKDLSARARANQLKPEEMRGGTFTVTNVGAANSVDYFTPIINQPESAILGVGRTVQTPVAVDGQIVIRPLMGLSLAFDHRLIDGAPAAEFLSVLLKLFAQPWKALI